MWQGFLVGLIVLVATLYAAWALTPQATRVRLAGSINKWARNGDYRPLWLIRSAARLEDAARGGGCEDCSAGQSLSEPRERKRGGRH